MLLLVKLFATLTDEKMPDNKRLMKNKSVCFDGERVVLSSSGRSEGPFDCCRFSGIMKLLNICTS